jgi:hypothetical protein
MSTVDPSSLFTYILISQLHPRKSFNFNYNTDYETFHGGKAAGREADHSPPASAGVKKMWIYTATPPYAFML